MTPNYVIYLLLAATTAELFKEVSENNGRVRVKGNLVLLFSDLYYLVKVNETIYQLKNP